MKKCLSDWILALIGWKIYGIHPHEVDKAICAVVPHTSWVDVPIGILVRNSYKADIKFLGKKSLFQFPFGSFLRWLGGYPVDRSKRNNFVDTVAAIFDAHNRFYLAITPEGTRRKTETLKSGYYWIARTAQIAIIMVSLDYADKSVTFHDPFYPTEDAESDMQYLESLVSGVKGRIGRYSYK